MPEPCWIAIEADRTQNPVKTKHIQAAASSRDSLVGKKGWTTQYSSSCDLIRLICEVVKQCSLSSFLCSFIHVWLGNL